MNEQQSKQRIIELLDMVDQEDVGIMAVRYDERTGAEFIALGDENAIFNAVVYLMHNIIRDGADRGGLILSIVAALDKVKEIK